MTKFILIIMYVDSEETLEIIRRGLGDIGLYLLPTVIITWKERGEIERRLSKAKANLMDMLNKGYRGEFSYAVIELTEDQYRNVRQLVVLRLMKEVEALLSRGEALLRRVKSTKHVGKVKAEVDSFNRRYRRIVEFHEVFDVKHDLLMKIMDLMREIMNEYEKRI